MEKTTAKNVAIKVCFGLLGTAAVVCTAIFMRLPLYAVIPACIILAAATVLALIFDKDHRQYVYKISVVVLVGGALLSAMYIVCDYTGFFEAFSEGAIQRYVQDAGSWGMVVYVLITILQVVVLPMPAAITIAIGVVIYDSPLIAFLLSTIGTLIGSFICFLLGKIFGRPLVKWMVGEENTEKYARILNERGKSIFIITMLFPAFPDDIICMVAGTTDMSYLFFTIAVTLTRPVMIAVYSWGIALIPFSGWGIPVWIALFCVAIVIVIITARFKSKLFGENDTAIKPTGKNKRAVCCASEQADDEQSFTGKRNGSSNNKKDKKGLRFRA